MKRVQPHPVVKCDECETPNVPLVAVGPLIPGETHPANLCSACLRQALCLLECPRCGSNRVEAMHYCSTCRGQDTSLGGGG